MPMRDWNNAYCPCCGRLSACYYSVIDDELSILCRFCGLRYKVKSTDEEEKRRE